MQMQREKRGGAVRTTIDVEGPGFGIGFMEPEAAAKFAAAAVEQGCRQIEVKCGHPEGGGGDGVPGGNFINTRKPRLTPRHKKG